RLAIRSEPLNYPLVIHCFAFRPKTTLSAFFPYTTLFRSESIFKEIAFGPKQMGLSEEEIRARVYESMEFVGLKKSMENKSPFDLDRKSTRLNSSHVSISYAVFCVKKKTSTQKSEHELKNE